MSQKLNQVLAIEKNTKSRSYSEVTELHKSAQKAGLYTGFNKTYQPKDEDGEQYPPETKKVVLNGKQVLKKFEKLLSGLFDITLTKDSANQEARADVRVGDKTIAESVPATTLLFLEKQLNDIHKFVHAMPTLSSDFDWHYDEASGLYKTQAVVTTKTKKVAKALVLHPPTKEHPAQTAQVNEDVIVGNWNSVQHSGALPAQVKEDILERVEKLQNAVKYARETANATEAPKKQLGEAVFSYLFGS